ncbi:MAG: hypothetical protein H6Q06_1158 [Acidobacteria bacterium]|nr:hypothetical protein [Acidobacteriota bacterium]
MPFLKALFGGRKQQEPFDPNPGFIDVMPARPYRVLHAQWEINHNRLWDEAWYVSPESGAKEKAWTRSVEFVGRIYRPGPGSS